MLTKFQNHEALAHSDQPLKEGHIHISAPHMYGCIVEALDLAPQTSMTFLNVGSGTGYLSCIVAQILGPTAVCHGVDIHKEVVEHSLASVQRWKAATQNELHLEFIRGNGLNIDHTKGEGLVGFDRIYVGAALERASLNRLSSLLRIGGVLVAPGSL